MKKIYVVVLALSCIYAKAQLSLVSNLVYGDAYNYPTYSGCPGYNCFKLTWSKPVLSTSDTLKGYNIYRNDVLYLFVTDTFYGCQYINICNPTAGNWFNIPNFWIIVKAVYNKDSLTSVATDSVFMGGEAIGINKVINNKNQVSIYPNPASINLTLTLSKGEGTSNIEIYNTIGECVHRQMITSPSPPSKGETYTIDVSDLAEGIYNLQISTSSNLQINKRLVIVR
ncbi:MAG: T9SS type A sorting domain-containing protein [Bacteroidia bacterium]